jgi:hypothetical protein
MTAKTRDQSFAQRDDTPASQPQAAAGTVAVRPADAPKHPDKTAGAAPFMATADPDFLRGLLQQLAGAGLQGGKFDEANLNFMTSVVTGIKPRDQLEVMLAAQMAAIHIATMTSARWLRSADNLAKQDSAERAFNKLARTFATQMEALMRYRTGGEQKVVQHVSVSEGGQAAIVGNVTQAPRGNGPASGT